MDDIRDTIRDPESLFEDIESKTLVATKEIRNKHIVVIYTTNESTAKIVTVYHSTHVDRLIRTRVERGVWLEKKINL